MEERILNIDGINIAFSRRGRGPSMLLLHGYPLDRSIWNAVAGMLGADFDLVIPDLRGFGGSDIMEADRSLIEYASDMARLLEQLKIRKAYVVGHSMGGYVGLAFVREFAGQVAGLGLISSQAAADTPERKAARQETARQVMVQGVEAVAEGMASKLSAEPDVQAFVREVMVRQRSLGLSVALDAMAGRLDSTDVLRSFKLPTVIIHGDADELIPVDRAREMKSLVTTSHYLELPGGGHMPMMENPPAVAEALRYLAIGRRGGVKILDD